MPIEEQRTLTLGVYGTAKRNCSIQRFSKKERLCIEIPPLKEAGKVGSWELYSQGIFGLLNGYYHTQYLAPPQNLWPNYILKKDGAVWMSTSPMELESMAYTVWLAQEYENVVIFGLGMGISLFNILYLAQTPMSRIKTITVVDQDPDIFKLFKQCIELPKKTKNISVNYICADVFNPGKLAHEAIDRALTLIPKSLLYVDIWKYLGDSDSWADIQKLKGIYSFWNVNWWGQEYDLLDEYVKADKKNVEEPHGTRKKIDLFKTVHSRMQNAIRAEIPLYGSDREEYEKMLKVGYACVDGAHSTGGQSGVVVIDNRPQA